MTYHEVKGKNLTLITPSPNGNFLIMPFGDSFAQGLSADPANGGYGYRRYLYDDLYGPNESHNIQFVGSQTTGTDARYQHHEGHGGYTIAQLSSLVTQGYLANPPAANSGPPQIVILTAGSNDFGGTTQHGWAQVLADTSAFLDQILAVSSNLVIVLTEQILQSGNVSHDLTDNTRDQQAYNAHLPVMLAGKPAGRVLVAHTSRIPQQYLDTSGVHPTDVGYKMMEWFIYQALAPVFGWDDGEGNRYMVNKVTPFPDLWIK